MKTFSAAVRAMIDVPADVAHSELPTWSVCLDRSRGRRPTSLTKRWFGLSFEDLLREEAVKGPKQVDLFLKSVALKVKNRRYEIFASSVNWSMRTSPSGNLATISSSPPIAST